MTEVERPLTRPILEPLQWAAADLRCHIPKVHSLAGMPRAHQGVLCLSLAGQRVG